MSDKKYCPLCGRKMISLWLGETSFSLACPTIGSNHYMHLYMHTSSLSAHKNIDKNYIHAVYLPQQQLAEFF